MTKPVFVGIVILSTAAISSLPSQSFGQNPPQTSSKILHSKKTPAQLTAEEKRKVEEALAYYEEHKNDPPPSPELQKKMQSTFSD